MAPQRRIDVVLDSVKRLLRIGATANLLNLLQKQHPADLAQVFGSLLDTERQAVFSLLVERNGRLAMETVSEMGPEEGAKLLVDKRQRLLRKLLRSHDMRAIGSAHPQTKLPGIHRRKYISPELRAEMDGQPPGERHWQDYVSLPASTFLAPVHTSPGLDRSVDDPGEVPFPAEIPEAEEEELVSEAQGFLLQALGEVYGDVVPQGAASHLFGQAPAF